MSDDTPADAQATRILAAAEELRAAGMDEYVATINEAAGVSS